MGEAHRAIRLWGGTVVDCIVIKRRGPFALVQWHVRQSWDGSPPFREFYRTKWRPVWRLLDA